MFKDKKFVSIFLTIIVLTLTGLIYGNLVYLDPVLGLDDKALLGNLMPFKKWIDIQPVRDLSYMIDLYFLKATKISIFHFSNVVYWLICTMVFWKFLGEFQKRHSLKSNLFKGLVLLLFVVHPVFTHSVSWIAARKHILSFLFTMGATLTMYKSRSYERHEVKSWLKALILYLLGAFANPINAFWPIWAMFYGDKRILKNKVLLAFFSLAMFIVVGVNFYYYKFVFEGHSKFVSSGTENIIFPFFSYGRYLLNYIFPFNLAVSYEFFSVLNLFGVTLLLILLLFVNRLRRKKDVICWSSYFLIMLIPVAVNRTDYFISNSYFLNASLPLFLPFLFGEKLSKIKNDLLISFLVIWVVSLSVFSFFEARLWESTSSLYRKSYEREKSYRNIRMHLVDLLASSKIDFGRVSEVLTALTINTNGADPSLVNYFRKFSKLIDSAEELTTKEKIKLFTEMKDSNPFSYFYLSKSFAKLDDCSNAISSMELFLKIPKSQELIPPKELESIRSKCRKQR